MTRRDFLKKGTLATVGVAAVGYPFVSAHALTFPELPVVTPRLPAAFDHLRVALISDVHHGVFFSLETVEAIARQATDLQPDLVLLLGDYAYRDRRYLEPSIAILSTIKSSLGTFAVLGNHDIELDRSLTSAALARHDIPELTNRNVTVERDGTRIHLAGLDDLEEGTPNLDLALAGTTPEDCTLLLCHNPDILERLDAGAVSFVFAGHTHGGQVHFPLVGSPIVPSQYGQKYRQGLVRGPHTSGYVTAGTGCVFPPSASTAPPNSPSSPSEAESTGSAGILPAALGFQPNASDPTRAAGHFQVHIARKFPSNRFPSLVRIDSG